MVKPQDTRQHHSRAFHSQNKQSSMGYPVQQSWAEASWPTDSRCLLPTRTHVEKKQHTTKPVENCFPAGFLPHRFLARRGSSSCSLIARTQLLFGNTEISTALTHSNSHHIAQCSGLAATKRLQSQILRSASSQGS